MVRAAPSEKLTRTIPVPGEVSTDEPTGGETELSQAALRSAVPTIRLYINCFIKNVLMSYLP
jgi:hypothetical protein